MKVNKNVAEKACICQSPLLKAHAPRYATESEKALLRTYLLHQIVKPHQPTTAEVELVKRELDTSLIVVFESPILASPHIMNVFFDGDPDPLKRKDFLVYDEFVVPVPQLELELMVGMEYQGMADADTRDTEQVVKDIFHTYVADGQGSFAH